MNDAQKLELTLCGMKPYNLMIYDGILQKPIEFNSFWNQEVPFEYQKRFGKIGFEQVLNDNENLKPILFGMDKLTLPVLENGLIPIDVLLEDWNKLLVGGKPYTKKDLPDNPQYMENWMVEYLKEKHFNVFDLPKSMYLEKSETI